MRLTYKKMPFNKEEYVKSTNGKIEKVNYNWNFEGTTIYYSLQKLLNKVGQLEDIEDELGIDLITLFKAFKNGVYAKQIDRMTTIWKLVNDDGGTYLGAWHNDFEKEHNTIFLHLKDYGKTWALTKEELL